MHGSPWRASAVKQGVVDYGCFVLARDEPREIARITRNPISSSCR